MSDGLRPPPKTIFDPPARTEKTEAQIRSEREQRHLNEVSEQALARAEKPAVEAETLELMRRQTVALESIAKSLFNPLVSVPTELRNVSLVPGEHKG